MKPSCGALVALMACATALRAQQADTLPAAPADTGAAAVHRVHPDVPDRAAARTFAELLDARAPGVFVRQSSGTVGAGATVFIRGWNNAFLTAAPMVVVDGVRVGSSQLRPGSNLGGLGTSALDDLDPEQIEEVTVLPGPAAAARYGAAGLNGVLEVRTRRAAHGGGLVHVDAFAEAGARADQGDYPANYAQVGRVPGGARVENCPLVYQTQNFCTATPDSILTFSPLEQASPFRSGAVRRAGATVSGSAGMLDYLAYAAHARDLGVLDENDQTRTDLRGSLALHPLSSLELTVDGAHVERDLRLPMEGFSGFGVVRAAFSGRAFQDQLNGYRYDIAGNRYENSDDTRRSMGGARLRWAVLPWLSAEAGYGMDKARRDAESRTAATPRVSNLATHGVVGTDRDLRTTSGRMTAALVPLSGLWTSTELGMERVGEMQHFTELDELGDPVQGSNLQEYGIHRRTFGVWLRERLEWHGLALDAGGRRDDPQAGQALWSYWAAGSWDLGAASFFPRLPGVDALRLRAAWGRVETAAASLLGMDEGVEPTVFCPIAQPCPAGPVPQRTGEAEAGLVAGLLGGRASLSLTGYRRDAGKVLILLPVLGGDSQLGNPLSLRNTGVEGALTLRPLARRGVEWEVEMIGSANRSRVRGPTTRLSVTGAQRTDPGRPFAGYFVRPLLGYSDIDGDGILESACSNGTCEVTVGDTAVYAGTPVPSRMLAAATRVRLVGTVTLAARVEHQGGNRLLNLDYENRCAFFANCQATVDKSASLGEQARVVAALVGGEGGFIEDASFTKLRELSLTVSAPAAWARRIGAAGADLTVAGRNLHTWTGYSGLDPEINTAGAGLLSAYTFGTPPLPRTVTTRLDLHF